MTQAVQHNAAARWLAPAAMATLALLLASMYFVRSRVLADVVVSGFGLVALLALTSQAEERSFLRGLLTWAAIAGALIAAAVLLSPEVELREGLSAIHSLAMIASFVIFVRVALRVLGPERLLWLIFAAGAISALASIGWHLALADGWNTRIAMLGRARNPIPAAAAIAVAALAGVALLRAGRARPGWQVPCLAGILLILLAMVLTQSRGPLIGVTLGMVLLLLPEHRTRFAAVLPPLVLVGASLLILAEAPLRTLFCASDNMFCRPSERLPLWQLSADLILASPLFGYGMTHQLGTGWLNNPQNGLLGTAVYFGLLFLAAALVGAGLILRRLATRERTLAIRWAEALMLFSAAYFAFEPSPFAFYNAHYLFLWLPVAVILSAPAAGAKTV